MSDYASLILDAMSAEIDALSKRLDEVDKGPIVNAIERQRIIGALDALNKVLQSVQRVRA